MTQNLIKKVKVAVYGSLREGLGNHRLLMGETIVGQFETEPIYTLIDLGSFPGLLKDGNTSILMEVYEVDAEKLKDLDRLEGYRGIENKTNNMYNREKIPSPWGDIFTYFYNSNNELLRAQSTDNGDWVDYLQARRIRNLTKVED